MPERVPAVVQMALREAVTGGKRKREPHLSELAQHFTDLVGGPRELAKLLRNEYYNAPSGGMVRMRILDIVFRATKIANDRNGARDGDLGNLSEDDLQRELAEVLGSG